MYELSINSNYVSDWDVKSAIRELLQNGLDSEKNGYELKINYNEKDNSLSIINEGATLDISTLVLGQGNKTNNDKYIGGFGEGYKLALIVLLRNFHKVIINTGKETLTPFFDTSKKFGCEVLKIRAKANKCDYVEFKVDGISNDFFNELKEYFPCIENEFGNYVDSDYGQILLDKDFAGKMFVNGLYIQSDENFQYGYNFNNKYVKLDRDRKAINYYALRKLTAKSVATMDICNTEIFDAICKSCTDIKDLGEVINEVNDDFIESYANMYRERYKIDDDTIVATDSVAKFLERNGNKVYVGTELESMLISKQLNNEELINNAKEYLRSKSNIYMAWEDLLVSDYLQLIKWVYKNKNSISDDELKFFRERFILKENDLYPFRFEIIIEDFINDIPDSISNDYINKKLEELDEQ